MSLFEVLTTDKGSLSFEFILLLFVNLREETKPFLNFLCLQYGYNSIPGAIVRIISTTSTDTVISTLNAERKKTTSLY